MAATVFDGWKCFFCFFVFFNLPVINCMEEGIHLSYRNYQYLIWCKYILPGRGLIDSVFFFFFCLISRLRLLNYYEFGLRIPLYVSYTRNKMKIRCTRVSVECLNVICSTGGAHLSSGPKFGISDLLQGHEVLPHLFFTPQVFSESVGCRWEVQPRISSHADLQI